MISAIEQVFRAGLLVFRENYQTISITCLTSILPFGLLVMLLLFRQKVTRDLAALFSAGLCGGILFDLLLTYLPVLFLPPPILRWILIIIAVLIWGLDLVLWVRSGFKPRVTPAFFVLLLLILILLVVKLAFISSLDFPLYTDSIEHYTIIQDLARINSPPRSYYNLASFPPIYYHYGYHILLLKQYLLTDANLAGLMLTYGQIILVIAAAGLYFPTWLATCSPFAALLTVLMAGTIWAMPGYAINWGKYPALTAFAVLPFVIGLTIRAFQSRRSHGFYTLGLLALAALGCALIHTRMLFILAILFLAVLIASHLPGNARRLSIISIALLAVIGILYWRILPAIGGLLEIYWRDDFIPAALLLVTAILCALKFPRLAFGVLAAFLLALPAALIHLPAPWVRYETLLDRPFFQISLYIPFSILVGSGASALLQLIARRCKRIGAMAAMLLLVLAFLMTAPWNSLLSPSDCCQLVHDGDLSAYEWLQANSAPTDRVLVAAVSASGALFETDGGAWIEALTGISAEKMPSRFDFASVSQTDALCNLGIRWIYVGNSRSSFDPYLLMLNPQWYQPVYQSTQANLFRLQCPDTPNTGTSDE